ncbi:MAG: serine/threonine-protein kinase [Kofleriaceae bacterium]
MIGVSVGQYECQRVLGEGRTGTVYLAVHRVLKTPRALKVLRAEWSRYPEIVERFIHEARAAAAIRHRNIIGVHDCGRLPSGEWYVLLDYLEGRSLTELIAAREGPLAPHDVVHILCEAANGVQAAHDHSIVHRDLKPDSLYVSSRDGDPRCVTVLDFGVAKLAESRDPPLPGLAGTPAYMAPERLQGEEAGPAADVFALGVIAYQMLSGGRFPFQDDGDPRAYRALSLVELYQRVTSRPPAALRARCAGTSVECVRALHAALDPSPARRPASPRAFALQLAAATPGDGFSPSGLSLVRTYARELLEVGNAEVTTRARAASPSAPATPSATARRSEPARHVSRYRVLRRIGAGGMAEVFAGDLTGAEGFARPIAIKRVRSELSEEPAFCAMFIAEARLASQLDHPNVVSVLDFARDPEGRLFLVMEYVDGVDLATLLERGPVDASTAIFILSEVLHGLSYAHELALRDGGTGLVHRDLSPHNVLLSREGAVKVSDFGIAKALEGTGRARSAAVSGKPAYMSPEQVHAQPLDPRSDLFAAGVILWEMLAGQRLFTGSAKETLAKVLFKPVPAIRQLRPSVSPELEEVVARLLQRDRDARYRSAHDAIDAILACPEAPRDGRSELARALTRSTRDARRASGAAPTRAATSSAPTRGARGLAAALGCLGGAFTLTLGARELQAPDVALAAAPTELAAPAPRAGRASLGTRTPAPAAPTPGAPVTLAAPTPGAPTPGAPVTPGGARGEDDDAPARARGGAEPRRVTAAARRAPPADPSGPGLGRLVVAVSPWARVWIDGKPYGETPLRIKLPPGRHRVRLVNHRAARTLTIAVTAARSTLLEQEL